MEDTLHQSAIKSGYSIERGNDCFAFSINERTESCISPAAVVELIGFVNGTEDAKDCPAFSPRNQGGVQSSRWWPYPGHGLSHAGIVLPLLVLRATPVPAHRLIHPAVGELLPFPDSSPYQVHWVPFEKMQRLPWERGRSRASAAFSSLAILNLRSANKNVGSGSSRSALPSA